MKLQSPPLLKELAEAVSIQSKVANRFWLALMILTLMVMLPQHVDDANSSQAVLPFGIGTIDPTWFYFVAFIMLAVLLIAFCGAHAQQIRVAKLAQDAIDTLWQDSLNSSWSSPSRSL